MEYIKRHLEHKLNILAQKYKIIKLTGARQVGKQHLLKHVFPNHRVIQFNPVQDMYNARSSPKNFLDTHQPPLILKGTQYVPELMPALVQRAREQQGSARYIVSSVYHLEELENLAKDIPDLYASLHLDGLTMSEQRATTRNVHWLESYLRMPDNVDKAIPPPSVEHPSMIHYLWRGALPHVQFLEDNQVSAYHYEYLQTYAERDARRVEEISDLALFGRFLSKLSLLVGQEIKTSHIAHQLSICPGQIRRWLNMLENTYQWEQLSLYEENPKEPHLHKVGYFRDSGLACALQSISSPMALAISPQLNNIFQLWAINDIMNHNMAALEPAKAWYWKKGNHKIPLVLEYQDNLYPIHIKCATYVDEGDVRAQDVFRKTYGEKVKRGVLVYAGKTCIPLGKDVTAIPWDASVHHVVTAQV